ncbi:hypothetical protein J6590_017218 [Homalodisca vitripennis]|nr:hypothetical protein J6590_017218 [Homalodisca vitripennis]
MGGYSMATPEGSSRDTVSRGADRRRSRQLCDQEVTRGSAIVVFASPRPDNYWSCARVVGTDRLDRRRGQEDPKA